MLLTPAAFLFYVWRGFSDRSYWSKFPQRFGFTVPAMPSPSIWVHAVSVGEVQASAALVHALRARYPGIPVVISTTTPTGAERVNSLFSDSVTHVYIPVDTPTAVKRFFDRIRPRLAIIIETEIWPNLYHECGLRKVPLVLANARISPRSVGRYRQLVSLFRETLSHGIVIAAQSKADAERFLSLDANPARTHDVGNIKFDFDLPPKVEEDGQAFRREHAASRPVWIAASTHEGEEEQVLDAFRTVRERVPDALLLLVPRHPQRFDAIRSLLRRHGWRSVTRSSGETCSEDTEVFLGDTLGELVTFYAASDVAFVAGSLVPIGGHNLLEPAALAVPVITGPYMFNTEDIAAMFQAVGASRTVDDAAGLAEVVVEYLGNAALRRTAGERGRDLVQQNRGALERLLDLIDPLLAGIQS